MNFVKIIEYYYVTFLDSKLVELLHEVQSIVVIYNLVVYEWLRKCECGSRS
jgi:hypothetical protein